MNMHTGIHAYTIEENKAFYYKDLSIQRLHVWMEGNTGGGACSGSQWQCPIPIDKRLKTQEGNISASMKRQEKKINTPIQGMLARKNSPLLKAVTLTMMFRPWADHIRSTYIRWTTNSLLFSLYFQCCSRLIMFRHSLGDSWNAARANMWASCGPIKLTQIIT